MVLGAGLVDADGQRHAMTGLLGHATSFARRKMHLGYRERRADRCRPRRRVLRGHEFHYATLTEPGDDPPFAMLCDARGHGAGRRRGRRGHVSGSFFHVIATEEPT